MKKDKFEKLVVKEPSSSYNNQLRITKISLTNYKFFYKNFEINVNEKNLLLYGENGSGKSSLFKTMELLSRNSFSDIDNDKNIFAENDNVEIEFEFNNKPSLVITSDLDNLQDDYDFLKGLSVFSPFIDYKKLLKVHYQINSDAKFVNLFYLFKELLKDFPIENNKKLNDISKNLTDYLDKMKNILVTELLEDINIFLKQYFDSEVNVIDFESKIELDDETGKGIPIVTMNVEFIENEIENYHHFLNEAKLSALAISIYFVVIKKLLGTLSQDSLKLLVLDDLLISLDMSNRLKLLNILKKEFSDFQIFFFTHDKQLFELYKNKMDWEKYEIYLDDNEDIPKAILKKNKSDFERAKEFYAKKEFDLSAMLLRKWFEKILKDSLEPREQLDRNCNSLNLSQLIDKVKSKINGEGFEILEKLSSDRTHILNPLSHCDTRNIHSIELKSTMDDLEKLFYLLTGQKSE